MSAARPLEVGDSVYVGPVTPFKVHWVVRGFLSATIARLESPMSGRTQFAPVHQLTLHPGPAATPAPEDARPPADPNQPAKRKPGRPRKQTKENA